MNSDLEGVGVGEETQNSRKKVNYKETTYIVDALMDRN